MRIGPPQAGQVEAIRTGRPVSWATPSASTAQGAYTERARPMWTRCRVVTAESG